MREILIVKMIKRRIFHWKMINFMSHILSFARIRYAILETFKRDLGKKICINFPIDNNIKQAQSYFGAHSIVNEKKNIWHVGTTLPQCSSIFEIRTHSCKDIITYLNKWMNYRYNLWIWCTVVAFFFLFALRVSKVFSAALFLAVILARECTQRNMPKS